MSGISAFEDSIILEYAGVSVMTEKATTMVAKFDLALNKNCQCGDGVCDHVNWEDCNSCPEDCFCNAGKQCGVWGACE